MDAPYLDPRRPFDERVTDLLGRMTVAEKAGQMSEDSPAIPRLSIPAYRWWSEALHGVARAGIATVFPQAIGLAATWDEDLMLKVATVISDEGRAKHHQFVRAGKRGANQGLTFFSPNLNIFRDPRWGRGHETYGEDPYLTGRMGVAFIKGMQGDDPKYLKTIATAKHYAVHSGPEADRHQFDARISKRELWDTYLPHFEMAVREGKAESVMSAYNSIDGIPASANSYLLDEVLRKRWGFKGYVVTDCGAIRDIFRGHKFADTPEKAAALAVKAGVDVECGGIFKDSLVKAVKAGLLTEGDLDRSVRRLLLARFRLGMFDPPEMVAYAQIPYAVNDSLAHRDLARAAAQESIVLLQNRGNVLPLKPSIKRLAIIGPTADSKDVLLGNYNGEPSRFTTILAGLRDGARQAGIDTGYAAGSSIVGDDNAARREEAVKTAQWADLVVLVMGLSPREEGEEGEQKSNPSGDRKDIGLPAVQEKLLQAVLATHKPVVLVVTGGSNLALGTAKEKVPAILMTWYSGEEGGAAVADVLFGKISPAGRLPLTFYRSVGDLPPFSDYSMKNRTYRYFTGEPLFPFGHGLSFTTFSYGRPSASSPRIKTGETSTVTVTVQNSGKRDSDDVVQAYVTANGGPAGVTPLRTLVGFKRLFLKAGDKQSVSFQIGPRELSLVGEEGQRVVSPGTYTVAIGGGQPGKGNRYPSAADGVTQVIQVAGDPRPL